MSQKSSVVTLAKSLSTWSFDQAESSMIDAPMDQKETAADRLGTLLGRLIGVHTRLPCRYSALGGLGVCPLMPEIAWLFLDHSGPKKELWLSSIIASKLRVRRCVFVRRLDAPLLNALNAHKTILARELRIFCDLL
ncbi:hypothetical protein THAOC_06093 [Thalassiosira oceanica]|uniref:Uncharacterized protein n=1 Tax=Thalassiosira oceanica TaxID=159749 RepID=K0T172_THAOC|nr:hypothetical protein THAOC_06093 [Thalassiosira oceanica]|eukprot:EJK72383.1 hypothetical protein THAOC_06093 [Thalassiosira oceanica]